MNKYNIFSNKYLRGGLLIASGLLLGWIFFHSSAPDKVETAAEIHDHEAEGHDVWTCSMHPQIRKDEPGDCPICGMDLIPLLKSDAVMDDQAIEMSESAMKLAEVQTSVVTRGNVSKEIRMYGKIQADERLLRTQTAHIPGRIEQLLVNVTGENVRKGHLIAKVYSPELLTAQKELHEALAMADKYPAMLDASREKLRLWKLSDQQISDIEKSGKVTTVFDVFATTSGIVANRKVNTGDYVSTGDVLFEMADLSRVWALFDAYESDLSWISLGQNLEFTAQAIPGKTFSGKVTFIDPVVDASSRITKVRVEVPNPGLKFKPEMFVNGIIQSKQEGSGDQLIIPQSAVLWTGTRSIVYVKLPGADHPTFKMREITLGSSMKDTYVVMDGLAEGEEIVTNGTFSVDAAAQLAGKTSMMNPAESVDITEQVTQSHLLSSHPLSKKMIKVSGECDMCKDRIETAAKTVSGVMTAEWTAEKQMLHVEFDADKTNSDAIQKAIAAVGHDTENFKASDSVYKELPECCLYRK
ncbi:MAG: efflux RND transporter periplasmic adaptor subunit [Prolixibacteraceae bacterium]|nr:efflux RND transporter periplasmic adaptor subunit [Prolixibacteraceae bacterium]